MKKTLITLLVGAGMASASTTVLWDMDFESTGVQINCAEGVATNLNSGVGVNYIENGAITLTDNKFSFTQTAGNVSYADEFTLLAVVSLSDTQSNNWPVIFSMGEDNSWYWKAAYYTDGKFTLDKDGFDGVVDETNKNSGNISYTSGDIITLALQNDGNGTLTLYVDGEVAGYTTITNESDYGSDKYINNFTVAGRNGNTNNRSNVTFYDMQLVKGLTTQIVPEPATASLSLLGLVALMIRRRRA